MCECFVLDVCHKLNVSQKKKKIETKMILCILLQDAFVSQFQKSAYPLGRTLIFGNRFQKFVRTSFLGKERREELCVPPSRNETAGLMGLQPSDNGEKPMNIYTRLSVAASFPFHFGFS